MTTKLSVWRWKVNRWPERVNPFVGRPDLAMAWLTEAGADAHFATELRQLLMESGSPVSSALEGRGLYEEVARRLASGELHLTPEFQSPSPAAEEIFFLQPDVKVTPAAFQKPPPPPEKPEPQTFPPGTSQDLAAQCLEKASEDGSAFCSECKPQKEAA